MIVMDLSQQATTTAIAAIFATVIASCYVLWRSRRVKRKVASEAGGAWPIIGHFHLLGGSQLPHITLAAMADKYGPIFTIRLGMQKALVVSSWEIAKECFSTNDVAISSRPQTLASKELSYNYAMFGFSPYGQYWSELRRITSVELLSSRRLELLKWVRVSETEMSMKELHKRWAESENQCDGVLVEMKQWFGDLALNVILRMIAGKRYFGATSASEEKKARRCQKTMREFFRLTGLFVAADAFPFLRWLDLGGHEKAMKAVAKDMDDILVEWLEEHRQKRDSGDVAGEKDFMDAMFAVLQGVKFGGYDPDTINKATCMILIVGGADTTAVMLTWAVSLLLNNRHVLRKAQEELELHVSRQRQVEESDINKLTYLQAIVKETLRLCPAAPLSGQRFFTRDCTVAGYHVPGGTRLIPNVWKIHRDPRVWSEPAKFWPERFLTAHKDLDVKGQHFELIPFGAGRRVCPGAAFGLQMLHLVLATFLHGFDVSTPADAPVDMTGSVGLTNMKATPLQVLIKPRLSANLY